MAKRGQASSSAASKPKNSKHRQRRSPAEIRERLLHASRKEFERCGYSEARTAAIAQLAEVTEAQLFRYFPTKSALFQSSVFQPLNQHFADFVEQHLSNGEAAADLREVEILYITEFQKFLEKNARLLLSLVVAETYSADKTEGAVGIDSLADYFEHGAEMMSSRIGEHSKFDPAIMVRVSFAAMLGCVLFKDWLFAGTGLGAVKVNRAITDFILHGIGDRGTSAD